MRFAMGKVGLLLLTIGAVGTAHASGIRPDVAPRGIGAIDGARMPLALSQKPVTLMVQLADDPVSVRQAKAGRKLLKADKDAVKGKLAATQVQLHERVSALGGTVLAQYQVSYNGMKVHIARDKAKAL